MRPNSGLVLVAAEDLKLNTMLFGWPQNIEAILELSSARIASRRERAEEELKARVAECEERHVELSKDIEVFRRKEVGHVDRCLLTVNTSLAVNRRTTRRSMNSAQMLINYSLMINV